MNRRNFLKQAAGCGAAALLPQAGWGQARRNAAKPNVVLIFADDLGYAGVGVQGATDFRTPNIDSIARNGVRFSSGYVSCPVCSPTRAGLMTGRYQQRFGHEFNPGPAEEAEQNFGLPLTETTVADRMKALGYATGMVGKWHLGYRPEYHPQKRGFDEFFGFLGGAHPYVDSRAAGNNPIMRGAEPVDEPAYLTDAFTREALAFIDRHRTHPFFLYLPYNAVHGPMQASEKYLSRFSSIADERRRTHAAQMAALDDGVGQVLGKLRDAKLEDNTLVFFISDNGGPTAVTTSKNDPLRGFKGQVLEGGIRTPFMLQWKGRVPAGNVYEQPVIALDVLPTAVTAGGGKVAAGDKLDGVDLLPYIAGSRSGAPHDALYWRFGPQGAIRMGDWKMVQLGSGPAQLYNLARDIGEANDLASAEAGRLKDLQGMWDAWNRQLAEPRWRARQAQKRTGDRPGRKNNDRPGRKRRRIE